MGSFTKIIVILALSVACVSALAAPTAMVVKFPSQPVGSIRILRQGPELVDKEKVVSRTMAFGDVKVPAGCTIHLLLNFKGAMDTSFLRNMPPYAIHTVDTNCLEVTDKAVEDISYLRGLSHLDLGAAEITDKSAVHLAKLTEMRDLSLSETMMTTKGVAFIAKMKKLKKLNLAKMQTDDGIAAYIKGLTALERLDLCNSYITDKTLAQLGGLQNVTEIILKRDNITDKGLSHLASLKKLRMLDLTDTLVTAKGLKMLAKFPAMQSVLVRRKSFKPEELTEVKAFLRSKGIWVKDGSRESTLPGELFAPLH